MRCSDQKNQAPELIPRPDLYGARFTSDRAANLIYIATKDADVKLPWHALSPPEARRSGAFEIGHRFDPGSAAQRFTVSNRVLLNPLSKPERM
jgi:hypothetical protein